MPNLKIDFVIGKMSSGGAERVVANLANYFAEKGHSVRIITFIAGDHYELNSSIERVKFHKKKIIKPAIIRAFFKLRKLYSKKANRPDIISSHIGMMGYATIPVGNLYGIKVIVSEHFNHLHQPKTASKRFLWNTVYKYANAITILTKFDLDFFKSRNDTVVVMENPCSFDIIEKINTREKVILAVGNMDRYEHKGFDNLMYIASKVLPQHPDWKLKFIGGGDIGIKLLQEKAAEYNISDQVLFAGFRSDVKELMSRSAIFVLSSRYEGLPMVLLEALSQGMACIAYDCVSGPSDIIDEETGVLVKNQDTSEMIRGLTNLIADPVLRDKLMLNGPESLERFSIATVGKKWERLIDTVLN